MIEKVKSTQQVSNISKQSVFLVVFLWLAVLASAITVIYVSYDTRIQFNVLESLRKEENQLQVVWGQYLLEESTWATYGRIEALAEEKLSMQVPTPEQIIMVSPDES